MNFQENWERLVGIEGGFVDDPSDSGGATKFGVTERVARRHGYQGPMRDLPLGTAMDIAKIEYWDPMQLDELSQIFPLVAGELFDTGYNTGTARAVRFLQRSLNALNRQGRDYDDQVVDGKTGKRTLNALRQYKLARPRLGESVMLKALDCLQGAFYIDLVERREKDEKFLYGWLRHRIGGHK